MLTPTGQNAKSIDKIMLLAMWTKHLAERHISQGIISAGMGKPTYPINSHTVIAFLTYWENINRKLQEAILEKKSGGSIDYGNPSGDTNALELMSQAMTKWYKCEVMPHNILFTVGGAGALRIIFETFNKRFKDLPHYRVISPFPHYTLYSDNRHLLHPVDVMNTPGYRLTGTALRKSIDDAYELSKNDGNEPKVFLLSNPSNPLGTIISKIELEEIASVLRDYPDINIVIDEAYTEMTWASSSVPSILEVAPDLKDRITILRSATKAHSAAGERMAMLINFNEETMNEFKGVNISTIGHAPTSSQTAYANAMYHFGESEKKNLQDFYEPKVRFVAKKLEDMCASMPDPLYKVDGTFYVMADLSDLFGLKIPKDAEKALGHGGVIKTSEELIYSLLFQHSLMLAPGQYFGLSPQKGFCRVTCSGDESELLELTNRLKDILFKARIEKREGIIQKINNQLDVLKDLSEDDYQKFNKKIEAFGFPETNKEVVQQNKVLSELLSSINVSVMRKSPDGQKKAAVTIKNFFKEKSGTRKQKLLQEKEEKDWQIFARNYAKQGPLLNYLLNLSASERLDFLPWAEKKSAEKTEAQRIKKE